MRENVWSESEVVERGKSVAMSIITEPTTSGPGYQGNNNTFTRATKELEGAQHRVPEKKNHCESSWTSSGASRSSVASSSSSVDREKSLFNLAWNLIRWAQTNNIIVFFYPLPSFYFAICEFGICVCASLLLIEIAFLVGCFSGVAYCVWNFGISTHIYIHLRGRYGRRWSITHPHSSSLMRQKETSKETNSMWGCGGWTKKKLCIHPDRIASGKNEG